MLGLRLKEEQQARAGMQRGLECRGRWGLVAGSSTWVKNLLLGLVRLRRNQSCEL